MKTLLNETVSTSQTLLEQDFIHILVIIRKTTFMKIIIIALFVAYAIAYILLLVDIFRQLKNKEKVPIFKFVLLVILTIIPVFVFFFSAGVVRIEESIVSR